MEETTYYLESTEQKDPEDPRKCRILKRIYLGERNDLFICQVDPPYSGQRFGLGGKDLDKVLIASRLKGIGLDPVTEWPVPVHIGRVLLPDPEFYDRLQRDQVEVFDWGDLYADEDAARKGLLK